MLKRNLQVYSYLQGNDIYLHIYFAKAIKAYQNYRTQINKRKLYTFALLPKSAMVTGIQTW